MSFRWSRGRIVLVAIAAGILVVTVAAAAALRLVTWESHVGVHGPAFAPDGRAVYFVERETRGASWGPGWEMFTPPARVRTFSDVLRLRRLDLASGEVETLETWTGSPIVGRTISTYRGRLFVGLKAALRPQLDGTVVYGFELAIPRVPTADVHQLHGTWARDERRQRGAWDASPFATVTLSEPSIAGERELFALDGPESFPSAIAVLDHADSTIRVVHSTPAYPRRHPDGAPRAALLERSRKADHDRVLAFERIHAERTSAHMSQGANETQAILRAYDDLRDLGYLARPERWVATPLGGGDLDAHGDLPRIEIDPMEITVGLFPDLEKAMANPGTRVDRGGRYLRHRDYDTSERLNALLDAGARALVVVCGDRAFRFELLPAEPATR